MKKVINRYLLLTTFLTLAATLFLAAAVFHALYRERIIDDMRTYAYLLGSMVSSGGELRDHYAGTGLAAGTQEALQGQTAASGTQEAVQGQTAAAEEQETAQGQKAGTVPQELRVTAISADGEVLYDSQTDGETMENHAARPEIVSAGEKGEGYSVRHSDTLGSEMYYFAVRLENGDILRISKEENSIWSLFRSAVYGIVAIAALMFLVCLGLSRYITAGIVRPIERLAAEIEQDRESEINGESAQPAAVRREKRMRTEQTCGLPEPARKEDGSGQPDRLDSSADGSGGAQTDGPDGQAIGVYEELVPFISTIRQQHADIIRGAKMRQEFTANVSHELKTPLTSVSGYAELIETGIAGEKETVRFAGEIRRNANRLLTLINDIIRLSELDGGHPEIARGKIDLHEVAQNCVEMLQVNAASHDIRIQCHGHRCMIHADRGMMEELLFNLCDNAIRYNRPGGRVDVTVNTHQDQVFLTVADTGIGIPKESQDRVFERFYRVDKSRSKSTGGTGLGLAIVKHIVALHRAELSLQSEPGRGTQITVKFAC